MNNKLRQNHLLCNWHWLFVTYEMNQMFGIMEQVVFPGVFVDAEIFLGIVLLLGGVQCSHKVLKWLWSVLLKIRRLPIINSLMREVECHLRPESLRQLAFFSVEIQYLICNTINMFLQINLVHFEHLGTGCNGVLFIKGQERCDFWISFTRFTLEYTRIIAKRIS